MQKQMQQKNIPINLGMASRPHLQRTVLRRLSPLEALASLDQKVLTQTELCKTSTSQERLFFVIFVNVLTKTLMCEASRSQKNILKIVSKGGRTAEKAQQASLQGDYDGGDEDDGSLRDPRKDLQKIIDD